MSQKTRAPRFNLTLIITIIIAISGFGALSAWATSSPTGSSPDEGFHLASTWCGQGVRDGVCEPGSESNTRLVPDKIFKSSCFAFRPEISGACQGPDFHDDGSNMKETKHGNFQGSQYPTGYFYLTSFFVSDNIAATTLSIRLFNSALFIALITGLTVALPRRLRLPLVGGTLATIVPLGMFMIASANPSSWSIMSAAAVFMGTVGFLQTSGKRRILLMALTIIAFTIGLSSRADSAVYAGMAVVAACIIAWRPSRSRLLLLIIPTVMLILAILAFLTAGQAGLATSGEGFAAGGDIPSGELLFRNILELPRLWMGAFGLSWGLGWVDTFVPALTWGPAIWVFGAVVIGGFQRLSWRKGLSAAMVIIALIIIPLFILQQAHAVVGTEVQPRYILPMIIILATLLLLPARGRGFRPSPAVLIIAGTLLAGANSFGLYANLRRYVNGNTYYNLNHNAFWLPMGPLTPMWLWLVGSLFFALAIAGLIYLYIRSTRGTAADTTNAVWAEPGGTTPGPERATGAAPRHAGGIPTAAPREEAAPMPSLP